MDSSIYAFDCPPGFIVEVRPEIYSQDFISLFEQEIRNEFPELSDEAIRIEILSRQGRKVVEDGKTLTIELRKAAPEDFVRLVDLLHYN